MKNNSKITFDVEMDENNVPESIEWGTSDDTEKGTADAILLSMWDRKEKNTLRIDLWTKEMKIEDMQRLFHQSILTMADTYERATNESEVAEGMRHFADDLGNKMGILEN